MYAFIKNQDYSCSVGGASSLKSCYLNIIQEITAINADNVASMAMGGSSAFIVQGTAAKTKSIDPENP